MNGPGIPFTRAVVPATAVGVVAGAVATRPGATIAVAGASLAVGAVALVGSWDRTTGGDVERWALVRAAGGRVSPGERLRTRFVGTAAARPGEPEQDAPPPSGSWRAELAMLAERLDRAGYSGADAEFVGAVAHALSAAGPVPTGPQALREWADTAAGVLFGAGFRTRAQDVEALARIGVELGTHPGPDTARQDVGEAVDPPAGTGAAPAPVPRGAARRSQPDGDTKPLAGDAERRHDLDRHPGLPPGDHPTAGYHVHVGTYWRDLLRDRGGRLALVVVLVLATVLGVWTYGGLGGGR